VSVGRREHPRDQPVDRRGWHTPHRHRGPTLNRSPHGPRGFTERAGTVQTEERRGERFLPFCPGPGLNGERPRDESACPRPSQRSAPFGVKNPNTVLRDDPSPRRSLLAAPAAELADGAREPGRTAVVDAKRSRLRGKLERLVASANRRRPENQPKLTVDEAAKLAEDCVSSARAPKPTARRAGCRRWRSLRWWWW
jgi:hypothetical protein